MARSAPGRSGPATVLITGATDGIGLALARHYLAVGARVIAVGRRLKADLPDRRLADGYYGVDLANHATAAALVGQFLASRGVERLDLLIHCAGVGSYGPVEAQTPEAIDRLLDTNLRAALDLTHALIPRLAAARGRVVFVGSVAASLPAPDYAVYGATKAALEGLVRALRMELRSTVGVQVVHPGATRTGMHAKAGVPLERIGWRRFPTPERVAARIARAIERGAPVATIGAGNQALRFAGRHLGGLMDLAVGAGQRMRGARGPRGGGPDAGSPHVVITGGADGIGRALAERYARAGAAVTLIDVDAERAEALCQVLRAGGAEARCIRADLARPDDVAAALWGLERLPPADVFVHSAGISLVGPFAASSAPRQQVVLSVNLRAPLQLTAGLLRLGLIAPGGTLVYIASLSVFTGYPGAAGYAASKDGLAAYARSLRAALRPRGVRVLTVYPGPTRTAHARRYSPDNRREARRMPPERLADLIADAVGRRRAELVPGAANRLFAFLGRAAPRLTEALMGRLMLR